MPHVNFPIAIESLNGSYQIDAIRPGDESRMMALLNIPSIAQNLYSPPTPFTQADAEKAIIDSNDPVNLLSGDIIPTRLAIRDATGSLHGGLGFRYVGDKLLNVGYYLGPEARGKKVLHAALNALFPLFKGMSIEGLANIGNRGSEQILLETGFKQSPADKNEWLDFPASKGGGRREFARFQRSC